MFWTRLTGRKLSNRPRRCWKDDLSQLFWECLPHPHPHPKIIAGGGVSRQGGLGIFAPTHLPIWIWTRGTELFCFFVLFFTVTICSFPGDKKLNKLKKKSKYWGKNGVGYQPNCYFKHRQRISQSVHPC